MPPDDLTPEQRIQRAEEQKREAERSRPKVDHLYRRLRRHLEENHFVERLVADLDHMRRAT